MTDNETTRIVAERMGAYWNRDFKCWTLDGRKLRPTTNADSEQLVREWARENLTEDERRRLAHLLAVAQEDNYQKLGSGQPQDGVELWMNTGDLTKAIAKVLADRVHAMHTSSGRVQEQEKNDHVRKGGDAT
jgi:hypothetical protein